MSTRTVKAAYDIAATVEFPDGYNGHTLRFFLTPLETRSDGLLHLQCAEPGQEHLFRWARPSDLEARLNQRS